MLKLPSVLLSAHLSPGVRRARETDRTEQVDPYVSYMMHHESDLGDGEQVIQTLIWSGAFLQDRRGPMDGGEGGRKTDTGHERPGNKQNRVHL